MCCALRLNQNGILFLKRYVDFNLTDINPQHTHAVISQNTAAITSIDRAEMAPTTECEGRKQVMNNNNNKNNNKN